jgi:hypothetical protein
LLLCIYCNYEAQSFFEETSNAAASSLAGKRQGSPESAHRRASLGCWIEWLTSKIGVAEKTALEASLRAEAAR